MKNFKIKLKNDLYGGYAINRDFQSIFCEYLRKINIDSYGYYKDTSEGFENDIFKIKPFADSDDCYCGYEEKYYNEYEEDDFNYEEFIKNNFHDVDCSECENFIYKPENIRIRWYKYALRDAYSSKPLTKEKLKEILIHCVSSIKGISIEEIQIRELEQDKIKKQINELKDKLIELEY